MSVLFETDAMERTAWVDGKYRYTLCRRWEFFDSCKSAAWIMLNPSVANAGRDDPTVRRCIWFSRFWGYGKLTIFNLFNIVGTNPATIAFCDDSVGQHGDEALRLVRGHDLAIAAWGASVHLNGRDRQVVSMLSDVPLYCLGRTKDGHPRHPLYVRRTQELEPFTIAA